MFLYPLTICTVLLVLIYSEENDTVQTSLLIRPEVLEPFYTSEVRDGGGWGELFVSSLNRTFTYIQNPRLSAQ